MVKTQKQLEDQKQDLSKKLEIIRRNLTKIDEHLLKADKKPLIEAELLLQEEISNVDKKLARRSFTLNPKVKFIIFLFLLIGLLISFTMILSYGSKEVLIDEMTINFDTASIMLSPANYSRLDNFIKNIRQGDYILVEGYTDDVGDNEKNIILSKQRAQIVANYLISKGISPDKIEILGLSSSNPIEENSTEKGRYTNRRVEITLTSR